MSRHARKSRLRQVEVNEEPGRELDFDKGDTRSGRAGDLLSDTQVREQYPKAREREAGMSVGENPEGELTANDLSPETLLDEDRSHTPSARRRRAGVDTVLSDVDESQIGEGHGKDEAELAQAEHPEPPSGQPRTGQPRTDEQERQFRHRREAARRGQNPDDYDPKEARAGDPERESGR
jgi:hypothetical protein